MRGFSTILMHYIDQTLGREPEFMGHQFHSFVEDFMDIITVNLGFSNKDDF